MKKTVLVLQTFLLSILPLWSAGFNISLSFPTGLAVTMPDSMQQPPAGITVRGKVIKESLIPKNGFQIKTVVIDPGHGGHDPGCLGSDSQEKHLALAIGQKLAAGLKREFPGLRVIMTRDADVFIPLHERAAIANRNQADLFISIHCNYMPRSSATHGSETYVMGLHTAEHNLDVAKRENSAILLEDDYEVNYDYDPNSPEGHIMLSMFQNAYLEQSILFAEKVEEKIHSEANRRSRGVKQAGFVVLKETAMPSVLVETGFLSNRQEEDFLQTDTGQAAMALAILRAFEEYRSTVEAVTYQTDQEPVTTLPVATPQVSPSSSGETTGEARAAAYQATEKQVTPSGYQLPERAVFTPQAATVEPPSKKTPAPAESGGRIIPIQHGGVVSASPAEKPVMVSIQQTTIPADRINTSPSGGVGENSGAIRFAVQLAASPRPIDTSAGQWHNLGYLIEVVREEGYYKYQARDFYDLTEADRARRALRDQGFADAFIVAYKNGQRISMDQARREVGLE